MSEKSLENTDANGAKKNVKDIGCVVQVTTQ